MGIISFLFGQKKLTSGELQFVKRQEKILADSLKIITETDKIDTFFSRYDLAEKTIKEIATVTGDDFKCIARGQASPAECLKSLYDEKATQTNNFLARYIRKETAHILSLSRGQMKKATGIAAIIDLYADKMPPESLRLGHELSEKMIKTIEKAVSS